MPPVLLEKKVHFIYIVTHKRGRESHKTARSMWVCVCVFSSSSSFLWIVGYCSLSFWITIPGRHLLCSMWPVCLFVAFLCKFTEKRKILEDWKRERKADKRRQNLRSVSKRKEIGKNIQKVNKNHRKNERQERGSNEIRREYKERENFDITLKFWEQY